MGNFITNLVQKQIDPVGEEYPLVFTVLEQTFNWIFAVELGCYFIIIG